MVWCCAHYRYGKLPLPKLETRLMFFFFLQSINFAVRYLAMHPEYVDILRSEFEGPAYHRFETTGNGLPLLDSFLKESARLSPIDSCYYPLSKKSYIPSLNNGSKVSTRRKALQPFQMTDGTYIERGKWICTPMAAMLRTHTSTTAFFTSTPTF